MYDDDVDKKRKKKRLHPWLSECRQTDKFIEKQKNARIKICISLPANIWTFPVALAIRFPSEINIFFNIICVTEKKIVYYKTIVLACDHRRDDDDDDLTNQQDRKIAKDYLNI